MGSGVSKGATSGPCQASTGIMKIGMDPVLSKKYMTLDQNGKVQGRVSRFEMAPRSFPCMKPR